MAYVVNLTARAERDLQILFQHINAGDSAAALRWYRGLKRAISSLSRYPNRCAFTPEWSDLRHLLYGRKPHVYRVIFRIDSQKRQVDVLHVRHGARRTFEQSEVN